MTCWRIGDGGTAAKEDPSVARSHMGEVVFGGRPFYQLEISEELIEEIAVIDQTHLRYAYSVRLKSDFGERVIARSRSEFICIKRDYAAVVQYPLICNDLRTNKLLEALVGL